MERHGAAGMLLKGPRNEFFDPFGRLEVEGLWLRRDVGGASGS
jgi:hypothetical protein